MKSETQGRKASIVIEAVTGGCMCGISCTWLLLFASGTLTYGFPWPALVGVAFGIGLIVKAAVGMNGLSISQEARDVNS